MQRDQVYLLDILESAKLALTYAGDKDGEDFFKDVQSQDSVIRRLEIIGEAAKRISEETKAASPYLPWSDMIGMRNIMIHEYDNVDLSMVLETVKRDLPQLIEEMEKIFCQNGEK